MKGILNKAFALISLIASPALLANSPTSDAAKTVQPHVYKITSEMKAGTNYLLNTAKESIKEVRKSNYITTLGQSLVDTAASTWQLAEHNPEATAFLALLGTATMYIGHTIYNFYQKEQQKALDQKQAAYERACQDDPYSAITFTI